MQTLCRLDYIKLHNACQSQILKNHPSLGIFHVCVKCAPWNRTYRSNECLSRPRPTTCITNRKWCRPMLMYTSLNTSHFTKYLFGINPKSPLFPHNTINKCDSHSFPSDKSINRMKTSPKKFGSIATTFVNSSATAMQPYMKLMRIDKPIGSWLLFWPCGWSIAMAAAPGSLPDPKLLALFGLGAFVMRGAGCTINDMWDKDIDEKVWRTKDRPLVTGEISQSEALVFLAGQLGLGLLVLLQLNWYSVLLGASSLGLVVFYPLFKRITYWPQVVLGMAFNWGALLGWTAVQGSCDWLVCMPLYAAGICWTIFYDTIYAHQDKTDDLLLGIKSTAIKFGDNTKIWLTAFGATMVSGLVMSGIQCGQTWPYYGAVGLVASHLTAQLYSLNISSQSNCAQKFISNHRVGLILFLGIVIGTVVKAKEKKPEITSSIVVENEVMKIARLSISNTSTLSTPTNTS